MARKTKWYMIEAIDQATINLEDDFMARDVQESVSFLCGVPINISIIGKVLFTMSESGYIKIVRKIYRFGYLYRRGFREPYSKIRK